MDGPICHIWRIQNIHDFDDNKNINRWWTNGLCEVKHNILDISSHNKKTPILMLLEVILQRVT